MNVDLQGGQGLEFYWGWKGKVFNYMRARLKGLPAYKQLNMVLIDNLYREYASLIASGYEKADIISGKGDLVRWNKQTYNMARTIADRLNISVIIILNFFLALYNLAKAGKIPFQKWNPKGYIKSKKLMTTLPTEKTFAQTMVLGMREMGKVLIPLSILGGIAAGYYFFRK